MIETFIARFGVYIGAAAAITVGYFAWDRSRVDHGRQIERVATEKANVEIVKRGHAAAAGAANPAVVGLRDPNSAAE